jgi:SSS family solute:Na+ symporter
LLKVWPVLIFLVPGLIGWALHQKGVIQLPMHTVNGVTSINGDTVFPTLVSVLLPSGIRGLIVACLLAALMSSLASLFNSSASLFTVDIYEKLRPGKSERHLLTVGRIATTVVVVLGILWIPVMKLVSGGGLYQYLQSVQGYLAPPITAVFLLGLFWKRLNATGAVWALGGGFVLGMFKLTCQTFFGAGKLESPAVLAAIGDFNFLYATGVLFLAAAALMIVASLASAPPPAEKVDGLTYRSIRQMHGEEIRASWDLGNKVMATAILVLVAGIYLYFSFWLG